MLGAVVQIADIGAGSETHARANRGGDHRAGLLVAYAHSGDEVKTAINRGKPLT